MRRRPSARLLVVNQDARVLLFRFSHRRGVLAERDYWATPGGGLEDGETFEQAAIRELAEETGLRVESVGSEIARREFVLQLADGENVWADERFFLIQAAHHALSREGWTAEEIDVMAEHRWWSQTELAQTRETVFPENLLEMLQFGPAFSVKPSD